MEFAPGPSLAQRRSGVATAQYKVESITECIFGNSKFDIECSYQPLARGAVVDAVEDRIKSQQRIARKIHLGNETGREAGAEQAEVDMIRTPRIVMIAPWIGTRLDAHKAIRAAIVGDHSADAGEVRIERRLVPISGVSVAARGIRLPDFDHGVRNRAAVFIEYAAGHHDALAESLATVEVRQVIVARREDLARKARAGDFRQRVSQPHRRLSRRSLVGADIGRMIVTRMNAGRLAPIAGGSFHRAPSFAISSKVDFAIRNAEFAAGTPA